MSVSISNVKDRPITLADVKRGLEALLSKPVTTGNDSGIGASGVNGRDQAAQLLLPDLKSFDQLEAAYQPNENLLGEEVARAVQFLPENIIKQLERKVEEGSINPQAIEELQIDLGRHVRVDMGASSKEAPKNGLGISPLILLGDPNKAGDNALKITQKDLDRIKSSIMFNLESGRGGLKDVEDLSRFSISERNGLPVNITIRVGKAVETPLPVEIQNIVLDAVQNKKKVLFLGQTGVGKTTLIRQISKFLSDRGVSPTIFDKSQEIAGHGSTPHSALGNLARTFVIQPFKNVAQSLISMIENHNPKALIIDELSDLEQFNGVRRMITEKGIPTAFIFTHGTTLGKAMHSENTRELLAKVDTVIVSDDTAQKTGTGNAQNKIRHNVVGDSMVNVVVEMPARGVFVVHENALDSMKKLAAGEEPTVKVYPEGTDIGDYRAEEDEWFIQPTNKLNPLDRPQQSKHPSAAGSSSSKHTQIIQKALQEEENSLGRISKSQPKDRKSSRRTQDIRMKSNEELQKIYDQISQIPEEKRHLRQATLFPQVAEEIERRRKRKK